MLGNFAWVLPGRLAGAARVRARDADELHGAGIRAVLCLTEEVPPPELVERGFVVRHEPIRDFAAPDTGTLARCVEFIGRHLADGRPVVVHCTAGYGRTGTVLAAYLVSTGTPPADAIEEVRRVRPASIETEEQEESVMRFASETGGTAPGGAR